MLANIAVRFRCNVDCNARRSLPGCPRRLFSGSGTVSRAMWRFRLPGFPCSRPALYCIEPMLCVSVQLPSSCVSALTQTTACLHFGQFTHDNFTMALLLASSTIAYSKSSVNLSSGLRRNVGKDVGRRCLDPSPSQEAYRRRNPRAWLFQVARNAVVDRVRAARVAEPLTDELPSGNHGSP